MHEADKRNRPLLLSLIISRKSTELYFLPYFIVDNVGLLLSLFNEEIGEKSIWETQNYEIICMNSY